MPLWSWLFPIAATSLLAATLSMPSGALLVAACTVALIGTVIASVHHAEVVAHRVGEPFGTLVLAVAITVIEVALIISVMLAGGPDKAGLARDTIFAAVMIIVNGVVGISVLLGALAHGEQSFRIEGAGPALAALVTLATLSLVLPTLTTSSSGPTYSETQLLFAAVVSFVLWALYVFVQTVRHRDYFLPTDDTAEEEAHAESPVLDAGLGELRSVAGLANRRGRTGQGVVTEHRKRARRGACAQGGHRHPDFAAGAAARVPSRGPPRPAPTAYRSA